VPVLAKSMHRTWEFSILDHEVPVVEPCSLRFASVCGTVCRALRSFWSAFAKCTYPQSTCAESLAEFTYSNMKTKV
jgi:hypothetical protein